MIGVTGQPASFYAGGAAIGFLGYAFFLFAGRYTLRPLRRFGWSSFLLPPRWPGCLAAGAIWVAFMLRLATGVPTPAIIGTSAAGSLAPLVLAVSVPLERAGIDGLEYGTQILIAGLALNVAAYSFICYGLCRLASGDRSRAASSGGEVRR